MNIKFILGNNISICHERGVLFIHTSVKRPNPCMGVSISKAEKGMYVFMPDNKKRPKKKGDSGHLDFDAIHVSSSLDCTGLIPSAPITEDEADSYRDLYDNGVDGDN